jgi:hypothetical protein
MDFMFMFRTRTQRMRQLHIDCRLRLVTGLFFELRIPHLLIGSLSVRPVCCDLVIENNPGVEGSNGS